MLVHVSASHFPFAASILIKKNGKGKEKKGGGGSNYHFKYVGSELLYNSFDMNGPFYAHSQNESISYRDLRVIRFYL